MKRAVSFILLCLMLVVFTHADAAIIANGITKNEATDQNPGQLISTPSSKSCLVIIKRINQQLQVQHNSLANSEKVEAVPTFVLPASLCIIEDEVFEGTAIVSVDLPDTVENIGERAFADIPTLRSIKIPGKVKQIAKTAFVGSNQVTVMSTYGSYAFAWARENEIPYVPATVFVADNQTISVTISSSRFSDPWGQNVPDSDDEGASDPTGSSADITDNRYIEGIANHIQGRSPPTCA